MRNNEIIVFWNTSALNQSIFEYECYTDWLSQLPFSFIRNKNSNGFANLSIMTEQGILWRIKLQIVLENRLYKPLSCVWV